MSRHHRRAVLEAAPRNSERQPQTAVLTGCLRFAVVATDYQGVGAPGGHLHLAAKPEAYGLKWSQ